MHTIEILHNKNYTDINLIFDIQPFTYKLKTSTHKSGNNNLTFYLEIIFNSITDKDSITSYIQIPDSIDIPVNIADSKSGYEKLAKFIANNIYDVVDLINLKQKYKILAWQIINTALDELY